MDSEGTDRTAPDAGTGSLEAALAHARGQAGTTAETQATIPASAAVELPDGVDAASVTWDETLGAGGYTSLVLRRDQRLRLTDRTGDTCVNLQVLHAACPSERLNPADTVKVQWQAYLGPGSLLLSDLGRVLLTVVADTVGRHDALCGHTNRLANEARYGHGAAHGPSPATRDLLALAAARHDLGRGDLTAGLNLFSGVRVGDDGSLHRVEATGVPGYVELRAELDLILLLAVGPHPLDDRPEFTAGAVRATAWRAEREEPDPFRSSSPERQRAFENTEAWLLAGAR